MYIKMESMGDLQFAVDSGGIGGGGSEDGGLYRWWRWYKDISNLIYQFFSEIDVLVSLLINFPVNRVIHLCFFKQFHVSKSR